MKSTYTWRQVAANIAIVAAEALSTHHLCCTPCWLKWCPKVTTQTLRTPRQSYTGTYMSVCHPSHSSGNSRHVVVLISHKVISHAWSHWIFKIRLWGRQSKLCFHPSSQAAASHHSNGAALKGAPSTQSGAPCPRVLQSSSSTRFQKRLLKPVEVELSTVTSRGGKVSDHQVRLWLQLFCAFPCTMWPDYNAYMMTMIGSNSQCQPSHTIFILRVS